MSLNPAVGDLLSCVIRYQNVATDVALNVLHFQVATISGTVPNMTTYLTAVAGQVLTNWAQAWKAIASDQVTINSVKATSVFPLPRSVGVTVVETIPVKGVEIAEALPLQDAITIVKRTEVGNRWGLGRVFVPGIPETAQSNGIVSGNFVTALAPLITLIGQAQAIIGTGWSSVITPVLKRGPDKAPISITKVVRAELSNTIIKAQKRRRPGKGI